MAELDAHTPADVAIATTAETDGAPVVRLSGEIDSSNVDALREAIAPITAAKPDRLVFDLSGLRFMDSAGIAVLVGAAAEVGNVRIRDPSPIVRRLIEVTGLTSVLPFEQ